MMNRVAERSTRSYYSVDRDRGVYPDDVALRKEPSTAAPRFKMKFNIVK